VIATRARRRPRPTDRSTSQHADIPIPHGGWRTNLGKADIYAQDENRGGERDFEVALTTWRGTTYLRVLSEQIYNRAERRVTPTGRRPSPLLGAGNVRGEGAQRRPKPRYEN